MNRKDRPRHYLFFLLGVLMVLTVLAWLLRMM
jgi:hypothetical protein